MKKSIYNNTIKVSEEYGLIYNTYTDMYIIANQKLYDLFINQHPSILKEYTQFYNQLLEAGCIIQGDTDEINLLKKRLIEVESKKDIYSLTINPTINCNFKCWYCYEEHIPHSTMDKQTLENVKRHMQKSIEEKHLKGFNLGFFGGEPLLYYKDIVYPLLSYLSSICKKHELNYSVGFTSNGYLLTDKIIKELKDFKVSSFQITLDGDKESHNKVRYPFIGADSYSKITENIKKLLNVGISVILRINYTSENLSKTQLIADDFCDLSETEKSFLQVDFQRVWQDRNNKSSLVGKGLLDKCIRTFNYKGITVSAPTINQVLAPCYADKEQQVLINYNGDVYKCTARDFTKENRLGILNEDGTITWDEEKMKQREGVRLSKEVCQRCRIAPICGGTCTQRGLDSGDSNQCIRGLDESGKDKIVLNQFYYNIVKNEVPI